MSDAGENTAVVRRRRRRSGGGVELPEAPHRVIALFDAAMVLRGHLAWRHLRAHGTASRLLSLAGMGVTAAVEDIGNVLVLLNAVGGLYFCSAIVARIPLPAGRGIEDKAATQDAWHR